MEKKWIFEGLKIADFCTAAVGPLPLKYLADHGAVVVKVESSQRPDVVRTSGPFKDGIYELDMSAWHPNYNTSKFGLALNMNRPQALDIAWKLIEWCDVLGESFTPGTMKRWGLEYESVVRVKPDIIYYSTCQQGQDGPHAQFRGYGPHASAVAGVYHLTGWPDREPATIYGAYNDFIAPRFATAALVAALDYRRRTGRGQHIDLSQYECGATFMAPVIMDYFANGRIQSRRENRAPDAAPHGAYPCAGPDEWVAVAVTDDPQWKAFCRAADRPDWAEDDRYRTLLARKEHEEELNREVASWTRLYPADRIMSELQAAGAPAGVVRNYEGLFNDPQMAHRGHFVRLEHAVIGEHHYDGSPYKLSKSPQGPRWAGPAMGQHLEKVCLDLLGMTEDELAEYVAAEVFE